MNRESALENKIRAAIAHLSVPSFDGDLDLARPAVPVTAEAAVLVLINAITAPAVILTKRPTTMRNHPGQVAFPGGRIDQVDADAWAAARREAFEEIGLPLTHPLHLLGALPHHHTITGFDVTPLVAINERPFTMIPEPNEVEAIFELPLKKLRRSNFARASHVFQGKTRSYYTMQYGGFEIWGATARILYGLAHGLENAGF